MPTSQRTTYLTASASLIALILLCLLWELTLSPVQPGGSWLVLKCLPLLLPLRGILHGRRYTFQWSSLLIVFYFAEGATRAIVETGMGRGLAAIEAILSLVFFFAGVAYLRHSRR